MTVTKGQPWGRPGRLPEGSAVFDSDRDLASYVEAALIRGEMPAPAGLVGGDLHKTMGGTGDRARIHRDIGVRLPVDVGEVRADGKRRFFVAHAVARGPMWRGPVALAMNAQWMGEWNLGPRSHPNDGRLDLYEGSLSLADRVKAARRARTGAHLPHPGIVHRRITHETVRMGRPQRLWLDGHLVGRVLTFDLSLHPDAVEVVVA